MKHWVLNFICFYGTIGEINCVFVFFLIKKEQVNDNIGNEKGLWHKQGIKLLFIIGKTKKLFYTINNKKIT